MKVMFVCMGNICRSPLAHAIFQDLVDARGLRETIHVESSGTDAYHTGEQADRRMRETAARHGTHIDHRALHLSPRHLAEYDLIIAMDQANLRGIQRLAQGRSEFLAKVHLLREFEPGADATERSAPEGVPDPYYGGAAGFETVYAIVSRCCEVLLEWVLERIDDGNRPARP